MTGLFIFIKSLFPRLGHVKVAHQIEGVKNETFEDWKKQKASSEEQVPLSRVQGYENSPQESQDSCFGKNHSSVLGLASN
jgi:hypothetical protein